MRVIFFSLSFVSLFYLSNAHACDTTVNSSSGLLSALSNGTYQEVCLETGIYSFTSELEVPSGKRIRGIGVTREDVVIEGSGSRVVRLQNNTSIRDLHVRGMSGSLPTFGVLSYNNDDQTIWGLRVTNTKISIGINGSNDIRVWDTFMAQNGDIYDSTPDPNLWISSASNIDVKYGELRGRDNGPGGDGELSCFNSYNVSVYETPIIDSGASAIYFVNCDSSTIDGLTIHRPNEWGIDVVSGSDNIVVKNNFVWNARFGGAVFYEFDSIGGEFYDNDFIDNVTGSWKDPCNGINVHGEPANVTHSGNYSSPPPVICKR